MRGTSLVHVLLPRAFGARARIEIHVPSELVAAFGLSLIVAVLVSERAERTVLSTAVIFLAVGLVIGNIEVLKWLPLRASHEAAANMATLALFAILFTDGAQLPLKTIHRCWRSPARALLVGMPLTLLAIALAARILLGTSWLEAFVIGAVLSPTDPVLVAGVVENESVPLRLRRLLELESGLNDGIALPVVSALLSAAASSRLGLGRSAAEAILGLAVGVLVPAVFLLLERLPTFAASPEYRPLGGFAIAAVLFGVCDTAHLNAYLAAFSGGVTLASMRQDFADAFREISLPCAEALKLAALLVFGTIIDLRMLFVLGWIGIVFAVAVLLAARPLALSIALFRADLSAREWCAAAWFGPKGFASVIYGLMILATSLERKEWLFNTCALVIMLSVVAHSSTEVFAGRTFGVREESAP